MNLYQKHAPQREMIINIMKQGGYYERIMDSGPELNRIKSFLHMIEGRIPPIEGKPYQYPTVLPIFPEINSQTFHERENDPVAAYLENQLAAIKSDIMNTRQKALVSSNIAMSWKVKPLWYLGVDMFFLDASMPQIKKIMQALPRSAQLFPLAEAIVSWLDPNAHLPAHNSTDCLRLRYSLGVHVQDFCELRVGDKRKQWTEGHCIIFEDGFEHEAWNGPQDRAVLIVDTWHPDLTNIEIEALTAGFRKKQIREVLYQYRPIEAVKNLIHSKFKHEDADISSQYWDLKAQIDQPLLSKITGWKDISVQFEKT